jgi:hypothetical protein
MDFVTSCLALCEAGSVKNKKQNEVFNTVYIFYSGFGDFVVMSGRRKGF